MSNLTNKDAFQWDDRAKKSCNDLKNLVSTLPILVTSNFEQPFVLECDVLGDGLGVVLKQNDQPIAFESKKFKGKERYWHIYKMEMLAIIHAITKWR